MAKLEVTSVVGIKRAAQIVRVVDAVFARLGSTPTFFQERVNHDRCGEHKAVKQFKAEKINHSESTTWFGSTVNYEVQPC